MSRSQPHRPIPVFTLLTVLAVSGLCVSVAQAADDPYPMLKPTITLDAVIRDFKSTGESKGHPDFESYGNSCVTTKLVKDTLDADGKPAFKSRVGKVIAQEFKNEQGQPINPDMAGKALKNKPAAVAAAAGALVSAVTTTTAAKDATGSLVDGDKSDTGTANQLTSEDAFKQWYRDVPGINTAKAIPLVFNRVPNTNRYVFDSATDEPYKSRGGFFPIDNELMGNFGSWDKNFHFTTEIATKFIYEQGNRQTFTFTGDDDLWVFVNGKLVLDLGGLHPKREQTLEMDRLDLVNGQTYDLKVFHAERHTTESNFRIETTITMQRAELPQMTNAFD